MKDVLTIGQAEGRLLALHGMSGDLLASREEQVLDFGGFNETRLLHHLYRMREQPPQPQRRVRSLRPALCG